MRLLFLATFLLIALLSSSAIIEPATSVTTQSKPSTSDVHPELYLDNSSIKSNDNIGNMTLDYFADLINNMFSELNSNLTMSN